MEYPMSSAAWSSCTEARRSLHELMREPQDFLANSFLREPPLACVAEHRFTVSPGADSQRPPTYPRFR
jgi:hypothetical protein